MSENDGFAIKQMPYVQTNPSIAVGQNFRFYEMLVIVYCTAFFAVSKAGLCAGSKGGVGSNLQQLIT